MYLPLLAGLAGASAVGNIASGYFQGEAAKDAARRQEAMQREIMRRQDQAYDELSPMYDPYIDAGTSAFGQLSSGVLGGEFDQPEYGQFQYDRTAQDFLDPSIQHQMGLAQDSIEESAVVGGMGRSGATMQALQQNAQDYAMQDYGNAYNRMMGDKNFAYQEFNNQYNQAANRVQDRYNKLQQLSSTGQGAQANLQNLRMGREATNAVALQNIGGAQADRALATGQQWANTIGALGNAGAQVAGGMMQQPMQQPMQQYTPQVSNNTYGMNMQQQVPFRSMGFNPNIPQYGGNI